MSSKKLSERAVMKERRLKMGVSSREKMNTNKNLARATTKSKSEMQTVSNWTCQSRGKRWRFQGVSQRQRPHQVSKIEAK